MSQGEDKEDFGNGQQTTDYFQLCQLIDLITFRQQKNQLPMMPRIFLLTILLLFSFLHTAAQNPQPAFRNYTTDHGLASPEVYIAMQDSEGYMWFGTDNGVSRFDGYTFRNYGPADGLNNNVVFDLQEDKHGRIWMMTQSGNVYYHQLDSIFPFPHNDTIQLFKGQFNQGHQLYFDDTDTSLYVTLSGLGILQIGLDGTRREWTNKHPSAMVVLKAGGNVLYSYGVKEDATYHQYQKWLRDQQITDPLEWHRDTVLAFFPKDFGESTFRLGSAYLLKNGGLLFENNDGMGLIQNQQMQWNLPTRADITNFYEDTNGHIFLCLNHGKGLQKFETVEMLQLGKGQSYLPGLSVVNMAEDKEGGYWFTSLEKGIFYTPNFDYLIYDETSGLSSTYVSTIEEKDDSTVFIGLRNGDIFELDVRSHHLGQLPRTLRNERYQEVIFYDKKEQVLWGGNALQYYQNRKWNVIEYDFFSRPSFIDALNIIPSGNGTFWVAGRTNIFRMDKASQKLLHRLDFNQSRIPIFSGYEDLEGNLWIGRIDGLWKYDGSNTRVRPDTMHPVFSHRIEAIQQLPDSTFILGTKGKGILLWKGQDFSEIREADGLTSDMIENVYVDKNGVIWVGTLLGLNKIFRKGDGSFSIENITMHQGLPSNEINEVEVIGDEVWVATTRGLVRFPYEREVNLDSKPPIITSFLADQRSIDIGTSPNLTFWENNITIHFSTINYRMNGRIPYRFRVDGNEWTETQNLQVNFPSLPPGNRTFEVQSQNEDDIWSESTFFSFYIASPWWETWWAISLGVITVLGVGIGIYRNRTQQLKKEIEFQKQLSETERQALRSQMNPHFIFNSLNAIQGFIAQGDKTSANRYLSRFAKLIRSALQHSRVTKVPLEDDVKSLKNYLELEQLRFKGSFDFTITIAENIDAFDVEIPPMLVQPFVENAIIHGLAKKEGKGQVDLSYYLEKGFLVVTVIDNGIGIEASKKLKEGIASSHKSIGLSVTARRLEMLSGNGGLGTVDTAELKDEEGQVKGTQVRVWIPVEAF